IYDKLQEFVLSGEIKHDDVPKVSTIQNWISRYHREFKEKATEQAQKVLEETRIEYSTQKAERT
ncbi:3390_t:CDS:1, partial [Scutellospora calospora]